jgi:hypothetical protein
MTPWKLFQRNLGFIIVVGGFFAAHGWSSIAGLFVGVAGAAELVGFVWRVEVERRGGRR